MVFKLNVDESSLSESTRKRLEELRKPIKKASPGRPAKKKIEIRARPNTTKALRTAIKKVTENKDSYNILEEGELYGGKQLRNVAVENTRPITIDFWAVYTIYGIGYAWIQKAVNGSLSGFVKFHDTIYYETAVYLEREKVKEKLDEYLGKISVNRDEIIKNSVTAEDYIGQLHIKIAAQEASTRDLHTRLFAVEGLLIEHGIMELLTPSDLMDTDDESLEKEDKDPSEEE